MQQELRFRVSYDEFLAWSEGTFHAEWTDGVITIFPSATAAHQRLVVFLTSLLSNYARSFDLGEVLLGPFEMRIRQGHSSRSPDILFVANEHRHRLTADRLDGPADLVVEIVSESSVRRDREEKFREYQRRGRA